MEPSPHEVVLERLAVGFQQAVSPSIAETLSVDQYTELMADQLIYRVRAYVLAEHLDGHTQVATKTITLEYPASPFQYWKQNRLVKSQKYRRLTRVLMWLVLWFVRRYPAKMIEKSQTVELTTSWDRYYAFPESTITTGNDARFGRPVRWLVPHHGETRWRL